jgi:hypothetical protein
MVAGLRLLVLCLAVLASPVLSAAHGLAGKRFFPATLTIEDPFVADELSLPSASHIKSPDAKETSVGAEFSKTITPNLGVSIETEYIFRLSGAFTDPPLPCCDQALTLWIIVMHSVGTKHVPIGTRSLNVPTVKRTDRGCGSSKRLAGCGNIRKRSGGLLRAVFGGEARQPGQAGLQARSRSRVRSGPALAGPAGYEYTVQAAEGWMIRGMFSSEQGI